MNRIKTFMLLFILPSLLVVACNSAKRTTQMVILTKSAPAPIGPYSQAILKGNTLFVSGQIAINQATNALDTTNIAQESR